MRKLLNVKVFFIFSALISLGLIVSCAFADPAPIENSLYQDKTKVVSQQIELLKNRLVQSQNELKKLQHQQTTQSTLSIDHVNKQLLNQAGLNIAVAKSNLDSINLELSESQQTITRLEKDTQEIENQLNAYNIFGLKMTNNSGPNAANLKVELNYQKNLLKLEKLRSDYLNQLQDLAKNALDFYKSNHMKIRSLLKSQTMMRLKEQQAKNEIGFQQQQSYWLQQLNSLYAQLNQLETAKKTNNPAYIKVENDIFYANENVNYIHLHMLIARYQDQLHQLKVSISHSSSITLLNKATDQAQMLGKQLIRVNDLLKTRISILEKRKSFLSQSKNNQVYLTGLTNISNQYKAAMTSIEHLNTQLINFRTTVDQALQHELSSRQGLPGLGAKAWLDLGAEILLVPSLTFQVLKSLAFNVGKALHAIDYIGWTLFFGIEIILVGMVYLLNHVLMRIVSGVPDHEFGHINLKWLFIKLTHRNLIDLAVIGNLVWFFYFCRMPTPNFKFLIDLSMVWLFFKILHSTARLGLMESVHDRNGHDVRLYHRLKWTFIAGGLITALNVFIQQLPLIFEVKDLCDRLFLLFLLIVSCFLLRSWQVIPGLILPHVDNKHTYVKRVIRLLGLLIPCILLVNSAIGLFGFVNFVQTITWYEGIFIFVLVCYLFLRGVLNDAMDFLSRVLIQHVSNGWLWTEAILKPIDKVLRVVLFFMSWVMLFVFYGWDKQSPVVKSLSTFLNYHLIDIFNTSITLLSILELTAVIYFLSWAVRWTREFVYRFLLSRMRDSGLRNSLAILSQYTTILIGVFVCLRVLGIDFRALTVVAGAFAFGVGLGLRDLVNNFVCGFLLLFERPLRVGDTVTISGFEGEVMHIGGRAVTIRTWDHMEVLVPNSEIFSKSFTNWTAKDNIVRTVITIKINRHDRPQDVQAVIYKVLAAHKDVMKDPVPEVFLKELTDGLIEFEVRYYINLRQVKSRISIRSEVLVSIWEVFEKTGIQPPYPHHEIYLKGMPELKAAVETN